MNKNKIDSKSDTVDGLDEAITTGYTDINARDAETKIPSEEPTPGAETKGAHLTHPEDDELEKEEILRSVGATSFAELDTAEQALQAAKQIRRRTDQFPDLIDNILMDPDIEDKAQGIADLAAEFGAVVGVALEERKERWQPLTDAVVNAVAPLIDKQETPMKTEGGIKFFYRKLYSIGELFSITTA